MQRAKCGGVYVRQIIINLNYYLVFNKNHTNKKIKIMKIKILVLALFCFCMHTAFAQYTCFNVGFKNEPKKDSCFTGEQLQFTITAQVNSSITGYEIYTAPYGAEMRP
jgi:hypothetical protein